MFTGIVETLGRISNLVEEQDNLHITVASEFTNELQIDQSVAHNGVCLTVVAINDDQFTVTAIKETLEKTNLSTLAIGDPVNLERCTKIGSRLDGHIVQGHVDTKARCSSIEDQNGSWLIRFEFNPNEKNVTVEKGSITINGTSLTVVNSEDYAFSVAIIPYTFEHTNFHLLKVGDMVNIEFDIVGKYIQKLLQRQLGS